MFARIVIYISYLRINSNFESREDKIFLVFFLSRLINFFVLGQIYGAWNLDLIVVPKTALDHRLASCNIR